MRRIRYQHDKIRDVKGPHDEVSTDTTVARCKITNREGNLREDPNGNLISSKAYYLVDEIHGDRPHDQHMNPQECHLPVLDLDVPHVYMPSQTPGHAHLYINKELTPEQYEKLLRVMVEVGLLGQGSLNQYLAGGASYVRLPPMFRAQEKIISGML